MPRCWLLLAAFGMPLAVGCGGAKPKTKLSYTENARQAYQAAYRDFHAGDCVKADPAFRAVRRKFPYSSYAALAELRVSDCLMREKKYPEAINGYEQFIRNRPSNPHVSYAQFRIAQAYFRQIPEDWLLVPPTYERDQSSTRKALMQVRRFLEEYPDDARAPQGHSMERKTLALLARHELSIAEFYLARKRPWAAIARLEGLLVAYRGSGLEPRALWLLAETYQSIGRSDRAEVSFAELVTRYPRTEEASKARAAIGRAR